MQAVVLAGGLGTRMFPKTEKTPKILLEVGGRAFADWQLEKLRACGYTEVLLCVAHLGDHVRAHVGDGERFGLRVTYADEGPTLAGTGGALRRALAALAPTFLVTYGDSYLPFDYAAPLALLDRSNDCDGVMSVFKNEGKWDASNVTVDGASEWVVRYEKGVKDVAFDHIDYGAIALRRDSIAAYPQDSVFGLDVLQTDLARRKRLRAYVAPERFFEIGSPEGLYTLEEKLKKERS